MRSSVSKYAHGGYHWIPPDKLSQLLLLKHSQAALCLVRLEDPEDEKTKLVSIDSYKSHPSRPNDCMERALRANGVR